MGTTSEEVYDPKAQREAYEANWETARTESGRRLDIEWREEQQETPAPITARQLHNGRPYLR